MTLKQSIDIKAREDKATSSEGPLIGKVCGNTRCCLLAIGRLNGVLSKYMSISISECNLLRIRVFVDIMKVRILI